MNVKDLMKNEIMCIKFKYLEHVILHENFNENITKNTAQYFHCEWILNQLYSEFRAFNFQCQSEEQFFRGSCQ